MNLRVWAFPFDASRAQVLGPAKPVTDSGSYAAVSSLSPDGNRLLYNFVPHSAVVGQLGITDIDSGDFHRLLPIDSNYPVWAPDGQRIVYVWTHRTPQGIETALVAGRADGSEARPITTVRVVKAGRPFLCLWEWSNNDGEITGTSDLESNPAAPYALTRWSLSAAPHAETSARVIRRRPSLQPVARDTSLRMDAGLRLWLRPRTKTAPSFPLFGRSKQRQRARLGHDLAPARMGRQAAVVARSGSCSISCFARACSSISGLFGFDSSSGRPAGEPVQITHLGTA